VKVDTSMSGKLMEKRKTSTMKERLSDDEVRMTRILQDMEEEDRKEKLREGNKEAYKSVMAASGLAVAALGLYAASGDASQLVTLFGSNQAFKFVLSTSVGIGKLAGKEYYDNVLSKDTSLTEEKRQELLKKREDEAAQKALQQSVTARLMQQAAEKLTAAGQGAVLLGGQILIAAATQGLTETISNGDMLNAATQWAANAQKYVSENVDLDLNSFLSESTKSPTLDVVTPTLQPMSSISKGFKEAMDEAMEAHEALVELQNVEIGELFDGVTHQYLQDVQQLNGGTIDPAELAKRLSSAAYKYANTQEQGLVIDLTGHMDAQLTNPAFVAAYTEALGNALSEAQTQLAKLLVRRAKMAAVLQMDPTKLKLEHVVAMEDYINNSWLGYGAYLLADVRFMGLLYTAISAGTGALAGGMASEGLNMAARRAKETAFEEVKTWSRDNTGRLVSAFAKVSAGEVTDAAVKAAINDPAAFATLVGKWGMPTLVNNVVTLVGGQAGGLVNDIMADVSGIGEISATVAKETQASGLGIDDLVKAGMSSRTAALLKSANTLSGTDAIHVAELGLRRAMNEIKAASLEDIKGAVGGLADFAKTVATSSIANASAEVAVSEAGRLAAEFARTQMAVDAALTSAGGILDRVGSMYTTVNNAATASIGRSVFGGANVVPDLITPAQALTEAALGEGIGGAVGSAVG
jgi:hypothetical protein